MARKKKNKIDRSRRINLSSSDKNKIKKYEVSFLNTKYLYTDRLKLFHKVAIRCYDRITNKLLNIITKEEINGELYLISDSILKKYNPDKSDFVSYFERVLFWQESNINATKERDNIILDDYINIDNEYYLAAPEILFNNRFLGKVLTNRERYIIFKIIMLNKPSIRSLSEELNISRESLKEIIESLKLKLKELNK